MKLACRRAPSGFRRFSSAIAAVMMVLHMKATPSQTQTFTWTSKPTQITQEDIIIAFAGDAAVDAFIEHNTLPDAVGAFEKDGTLPDAVKAFESAGTIPSPAVAEDLIRLLTPPSTTPSPSPDPRADWMKAQKSNAVIFDIVQWQDQAHDAKTFHQWYVLDRQDQSLRLLWGKESDLLNRTFLAGDTDLSFVYIFLGDSAKNTKGQPEPDDFPTLFEPVSYNIVEAQASTSLVNDFKTILSLVSPIGVPETPTFLAAVEGPKNLTGQTVEGVSAVYNFSDDYKTSTITIGSKYFKEKTADNSPAFANEDASYWGFSAMYPVTSYKDVKFSGTSYNLQPQSVKQQSAYIAFDVYVPKVQPQLQANRWFPHAFVALPAGGKVLEHPMGGLAFSLKYASVFYGVVWDWENKGPGNRTDPVGKGTFGVEMTISNFKALVAGATGGSKAGATTGQ